MVLGRRYVPQLFDFVNLIPGSLADKERISQVGDPIEALAVANVFGDHGVYIGSVSNKPPFQVYCLSHKALS